MPEEPRALTATTGSSEIGEQPVSMERAPTAQLDVLKALGDNTRYAVYLELARSPLPLSTPEIAERLELHVNTVRPHLERMREVGLLVVEAERTGSVGRPQHRFRLAPDAPSLGLEPPAWPVFARVVLAAAATAGIDAAELVDAGAEQGRADAHSWHAGDGTVAVLVADQMRMGFDPEVVDADERTTVAFTHCPFRELAEGHPELVCSMHCGMVEGLVDELGGARVVRFHSLVDREPCQVELAAI